MVALSGSESFPDEIKLGAGAIGWFLPQIEMGAPGLNPSDVVRDL